jgi:hypothetical protein
MNAPQVVLSAEQEQSLYTVGTISYMLHAIVAVGAVLPGSSPACLLLIAGVVVDLVKRDDARGSVAGEPLPLPAQERAPTPDWPMC